MRKQSWIVNVVLLALAAILGMKLRGDWVRTIEQHKASDAFEKSAATPGAAAPNAAAPPIPGAESIAQNNLFSPDRNNVQAQPVELKPAPPDPLLLGSMNVGSGPIALMVDGAAQPSTPAHPVREGETIGGYKLVKVGDTFAMVEYEGQEKRIEVQSAPRQDNRLAPAPSAPQRPQQTTAAPLKTVGPGSPSSNVKVLPDKGISSTGDPKTRSSFDMFGPGVQDNYPAGTNLNGWQKVEKPWPFGGKQVWWEKVQ
jgi:hypothetical protein